jgi:thioredoxin reductase (NADPH)
MIINIMPQRDTKCHDLIIVGAGPAGLEAALQAKARGLSYLLFDKDDAGALIKNTLANKRFLHIYGRNTAFLKGALPFPDYCMGEELVAEWRKVAEGLELKKGVNVLSAKKDGGEFLVETDELIYRSKNLLVSSGIFEEHRKLEVEGEKGNAKVLYALDYYNDYSGKNILIIGGGNSAAEAALYCAPNNRVIMLVREADLASSVTDINRSDLLKFASEGKINLRFNSTVEKIDESKIYVKKDGAREEYDYDIIFALIGFVSPADFLAKMGVPAKEAESVPGLYLAGSLTGADSIIESANQGFDAVGRIS